MVEDPNTTNSICAWCQKALGHTPRLPKGVITHGICRSCTNKVFGEPFSWLDEKDTGRIRRMLSLTFMHRSTRFINMVLTTFDEANEDPSTFELDKHDVPNGLTEQYAQFMLREIFIRLCQREIHNDPPNIGDLDPEILFDVHDI